MVTSLSADEKRSLLARRLKQSAGQKLFHRGFEEQAAQSPNAIAVVYGDQAVTYQALNTRANGLARRLRALVRARDAGRALCRAVGRYARGTSGHTQVRPVTCRWIPAFRGTVWR